MRPGMDEASETKSLMSPVSTNPYPVHRTRGDRCLALKPEAIAVMQQPNRAVMRSEGVWALKI